MPETKTIRCLPMGLCSWNYRLEGGGVRGSLDYATWTEQGTLRTGAESFRVKKHGALSGRWTLESSRGTSFIAQKSISRHFEISTALGALVLEAESAFTRRFHLTLDGRVLAKYTPDHAFTRRATIEVAAEVDDELIAFTFWLVALCWRRANQAAAAS